MTVVEKLPGGGATFNFDDVKPFGYEIAIAASPVADIPREVQAAKLQEALYDTRSALRRLQTSKDPNDIAHREGINARFYTDNLFGRHAHQPYGGNRAIIGWLARASYDELRNFSEWNVSRHERHQTALITQLPQLQEVSRARAERLVSLGVWPKHAIRAFDRAFRQVHTVHAMDSFLAGSMVANGYYDGKERCIGFSNLFDLPADYYGVSGQFQAVGFHEYMHASGDLLSEGGFMAKYELDAMRPLEEFIVSHFTQVSGSHHPDPDIFNPEEREDSLAGSYETLRRFMALVLEAGPSNLDAEVLGSAYFNMSAAKQARTKVLQALDRNIRAVVPSYQWSGFKEFVSDFETEYTNQTYEDFLEKHYQAALGRLGIEHYEYDAIEPVDPEVRLQRVADLHQMHDVELADWHADD